MKVEYKFTQVKNQKLYYATAGKGKPTIFLLGWLSSIDKFPIEKLLKEHKDTLNNNQFIFLHLSNQYKSSISNIPYGVELYADQTKHFCDKLKVKKVNIVAHSAGGRYAVFFAKKYPNIINKLILISPAGSSSKKASKTQLKRVKYYFNKFETLTQKEDIVLKQTFNNVFGYSTKPLLTSIKAPTLIIWGTKDKIVPYKKAKIFNSRIKNVLFYKIKNQGHMVITNKKVFGYVVNFVNEEKSVINKLIKLNKEKEIPKTLKNYKYNYLRVNPTYKSRRLFVLFISKSKILELNRQYVNLASSLEKLCRYILKTNNPKFKALISVSGVNFGKLRNKSYKNLFNYSRIDSLYNTKNAQILEFNARRPQMFEDVDWFNEYLKIYKIKDVRKYNLTDNIVESIKNQCENNKLIPKNILLISNFEKKGNFSFYSRLKTGFKSSNIINLNTRFAAKLIKQCSINNNKLLINKTQIDLIIIQSLGTGKNSFFYSNGKIVNKNIRKAYDKNLIQINSPVTSSVFGRKQSLELLTNPKVQKILKLTSLEINTLNKLPKSKELIKMSQIKPNYVVKIQGLGSGKGVYYHQDITEKRKVMFKKLIDRHSGKILLQEKVEHKPIKVYNLKTLKPVKASVSLEPFIININGKYKVYDYTVRAIPKKYLKANSKFNPVYNKPEIWFGSVVEY